MYLLNVLLNFTAAIPEPLLLSTCQNLITSLNQVPRVHCITQQMWNVYGILWGKNIHTYSQAAVPAHCKSLLMFYKYSVISIPHVKNKHRS